MKKDHKLFQKLPFRQSDSEVELSSFLETSRRNFKTRTDENNQVNDLNITIIQALEKAQKQKSRQLSIQVDKDSNNVSQPLNLNFHTSNLQNYQDQKLSNQVTNHASIEFKKVEPIRLMKVLKLLVNIQHFFRILSMNSRIFNKLTQYQHHLIGDVASFYSKNIKLKNGSRVLNIFNNFIYILFQIIQTFNNRVFTPSNYLIKTWDGLQSILIIFSTFLLNLELFFEMDISNYQLLFQILFNISAIDILVVLNTGVLKKGNIIYDRGFILKSYLKNTLYSDIFGNIPLFFYITKGEVSQNMKLINNVLFIFKWAKIFKVLKKFAYYICYEKNHKNIFDLFKQLQKCVYDINNRESLFDILDQIESNINDIDFKDSDQLKNEYEKKWKARNTKFYMEENQIENQIINNHFDMLKKFQQNSDQQQERSFDGFRRQSQSNLSILQQSLSSIQKNAEQINQPYKKPKQSLRIHSNQQLQSEIYNDKIQEEEDQISQSNQKQTSQSSSSLSSSECDTKSASSQSRKYKKKKGQNYKKNSFLIDDEQRQIIQELVNHNKLLPKKSSFMYQKMDQNIVNFQKQKSNVLQYNYDQNSEYQFDDSKSVDNSEKEKNNNNNTIQLISLRSQRGKSQIMQLENFQNQTFCNSSEVQNDSLRNVSIKNIDSSNQQLKLQPKKSILFKQVSTQNTQNGSKGTISSNSQHITSFQKQIPKRDYLGFEKPIKSINEINEFPDQDNYQMLQIFDKAKIFKYYQPHFNYPEIVKKWIQFQVVQQKSSKTQNIQYKNKRQQNKCKLSDIA